MMSKHARKTSPMGRRGPAASSNSAAAGDWHVVLSTPRDIPLIPREIEEEEEQAVSARTRLSSRKEEALPIRSFGTAHGKRTRRKLRARGGWSSSVNRICRKFCSLWPHNQVSASSRSSSASVPAREKHSQSISDHSSSTSGGVIPAANANGRGADSQPIITAPLSRRPAARGLPSDCP